MSNETTAVTDPAMLAAVFNENWQNARNVKSERISLMNTFSLVSAGVLTLLQSVRGSAMLEISLLLFMCLFSVVGLLTSLRLKGELEECLAKIQAISVQMNVSDFVALGQVADKVPRYPKFRWMFPLFYSMTTAGFVALIVYRLLTGEPIR
jgi:hypothetical protein